MNDKKTILNVKNLTLKIGELTILNNVSLSIDVGETLAIVGETGSGKSLTALSIMRLLPQKSEVLSGTIEFNSKNLLVLTEREMQRLRGNHIGMIFQEPNVSLNPVLTIGQQVAESLHLHQGLRRKKLRQEVIKLLYEVQLPNPEQRIDWYPHQLSGGQKQRVMIAIAIACKPDLLIADEPTTALDVTIQAQILALLKRLQAERNISMLLITHDMGVVAQVSDHVTVMRQGEIMESASNKEFFSQAKHEYSQSLLQALPNMHNFRPAISDAKTLLDVKNLNVRFPIKQGLLKRTKGYTHAVNNFELQLYERETVAVVGESGSGKSTVGRAILRLLDGLANIKGSIVFQAHNIDTVKQNDLRPLRQHLQIVFQDPYSSLNPRLSIEETVSEGMLALSVVANKREAYARCVELMQSVGLEASMLERYPNEFSGGQRQRIAIARTLAVKPKLIICDEPTSALDVSVRKNILQLLNKLQQQYNLGLMFITHDLSLIPHIAHRVIVMKEGNIVEMGSAEQILLRPQQAYTQSLVKSIPALAWAKNR